MLVADVLDDVFGNAATDGLGGNACGIICEVEVVGGPVVKCKGGRTVISGLCVGGVD